jgi:hypothetical protein
MTIIRPLESVLGDKEMLNQIKNSLKSSGHEIPEKDIDNSRRSFMKGSAGLAAGLAVGGLGFSSKAEARNIQFLENPGPGVTNSRYQQFAGVYQFGCTTRFTTQLLNGFLHIRKGNKIILGGKEYKLPSEVPYIEPLYAFAGHTLKNQYDRQTVGTHYPDDLESKNLAMHYFDSSLVGFFEHWIDTSWNKQNTIWHDKGEEFALAAICVAAFGKDKGEQAAKGMLDSSVEGKKIYAKKIIESFSRMKNYDKNSKDPQNPFNQALVANWAAYVITNHFENLQIKQGGYFTPDAKYYDEVRFYQEHLEKPLEQFAYKIRPDFDSQEEYHNMNRFKVGTDSNGHPILKGIGRN